MDSDFTKGLIELLEAKGLSEERRSQVLDDLNEAICLNLVGRLATRLLPDAQDALVAERSGSVEDVMRFFSKHVPKADIEAALALAAEDVMDRFLTRIEAAEA